MRKDLPGRNLAILGVVLQTGFFAGLAPYFTAIYTALFGFLLAVIGVVLLFQGLFVARYRAPWFHAALWSLSIFWLFGFPVGTVLGAGVMIWMTRHGEEFQRPGEAV